MVNIFGFIRYFAIHEGNMADCQNLSRVIDKLSRCTNAPKPVIVLYAGITAEENLAMIKDKGYHYLCVSRTKLKNYRTIPGRLSVLLPTKTNRNVRLKAISTGSNRDYYL